MTDKAIHFFDYLGYDDIEGLDITYENPHKGENQTYVANLINPLSFYLPKSEIIDIYQDSFGNNIASYLINITDHAELLSFLENMDTLCIEHASVNSEVWFKKQLTHRILVKYYNSLYNLDDQEEDNQEQITIDLEIPNYELLNRIEEYNKSETLNLVVTIYAIEFFKQTFRWKIELTNMIDGIDQYDSEESEIDFNETMDKIVTDEEPIVNSKKDNLEEDKSEKDIKEDMLTQNQDNLNKNDDIQLDRLQNVNTKENVLLDSSPCDTASSQHSHRESKELSKENDNVVNDLEENNMIKSDNDNIVEIDKETLKSENNDEEIPIGMIIEETNHSEKENKEDLNDDTRNVKENTDNVEETVKDIEENMEDKQSDEKETSDSKKEVLLIEDSKNQEEDNQKVITDEVISELAKNDIEELTTPSINKENSNVQDTEESQETSSNSLENEKYIDTKTLIEIESIINDKRIEAKKYLLNAERANKASASLREKANRVNLEVKNYEDKLRNLSQGSIH